MPILIVLWKTLCAQFNSLVQIYKVIQEHP
jgi:hypothetical protein